MFYFLILLVFPALLGLWAQARVHSVFDKNAKLLSRSGITGREAARFVLESADIHDVAIESADSFLGDHYDPAHKRLVLSTQNYRGTSLAALGIAAHEAGHAIQHKESYAMLKLRMALVPITMFSSNLLPFIILGGFFFRAYGLLYLGVACYFMLTLFQLITLPVEFDASRRAEVLLNRLGIIGADERKGVHETLKAAGWTYVAAFVASLGNLLHLLLILSGSRRSND
ncbi:MAG: zinc metallopeptidase [Puniceicoccales bacterium]|jgi:Zn-dependent membrane protease YugP|nr:zinc metallopeptidase [Puniceicoccales bacterium]